MRPFVAAGLCAGAALICSASVSVGAAGWRAGDMLAYDVTIELQQHNIPKAGSAKKETTKESASAGTLTFVVTGVDASGNLAGTARLSFLGGGGGQYDRMARTVSAVVTRDGRMTISGLQGSQLEKALALANEAIAEVGAQPLRAGRTWQSGLALAGFPAPMRVVRAIGVARQYRGYPTYPIGTIGSSTLENVTQVGKLSLSSTTYYDAQDRLLIGESVRNFTVVLNKAGGHADSTAIVNIALRAIARAPAGVSTKSQLSLPQSATTPAPAATGPYTPAYGAPVSGATTEPGANPVGPSPLPTVTP